MRVEDLVLLVGSNPYPNYLVARLLQPRRLYLIVSRQTVQGVAPRLAGVLKKVLPDLEAVRTLEAGHADPRDIRRVVRELPEGTHLNYTGGTKAMAVHVYEAWKERGGRQDQASYLDGRAGALVVADGHTSLPIAEGLDVSLETLAELHGLTMFQFQQPALPGQGGADQGPTLAQGVALTRYALGAADAKAMEARLQTIRGAGTLPQPAEELSRQVPGLPPPDPSPRGWREFLEKNQWFEYFVADALQRTQRVRLDRLYTNVKARNDGREFELDVVALVGHRIYAASCTTADSVGACKEKLFEVTLRARQIGGDLARMAVVCLVATGGQLTQLKNELRPQWDAPAQPEIFGLDDVRQWAAVWSPSPRLDSLRKWLGE